MENIDFNGAVVDLMQLTESDDFSYYSRKKTAEDLADLWIENQYASEDPPWWTDEQVQEIFGRLVELLVAAGFPRA